MRKFVYPLLIMFLMSFAIANAHPALKPVNNNRPTGSDSTLILIPFDYKQSALYHQFTFEVIDSVVKLMLKDTAIKVSIDGYAHQDEGSDTICKYLSLNRALFVKDYMLGRGVDPARITLVRGMGKLKSKNSDVNKDGHILNCKAELHMQYPSPPKPVVISDKDNDGIADADDACPESYGYKENKGCPDKDAIIIPFEFQVSSLAAYTYKALDSVINVLKENPALNVAIEGHAYPAEGINAVCEKLAMDRASIVKNYFLSRNIPVRRIVSVESFGNRRPFNAGTNPMEVAQNARAQLFLRK
ncbi:OmpA family protein [Ferruginibacter sp.]